MEKNCSNCKVAQGNEWHKLCSTCTVNSEEGTEDNYQPLEPTYATLAQCKVLKEKGFSIGTRNSITEYLKTHKSDNPSFSTKKGEVEIISGYILNNGPGDFSNKNYTSYECPEQWQVVEYLRVKHSIWINVNCDYFGENWYVELRVASKKLWNNVAKRSAVLLGSSIVNDKYSSPQEAISSAIDYILTNLI